MDKNTAYQVISQFKENNCNSEALANALDEALKALGKQGLLPDLGPLQYPVRL